MYLPVVLAHVMEIVPADDDGPLHLHLDDSSLKNTATDVHIAGEGALLVDVCALDCLSRGLKAQPYVLVVPVKYDQSHMGQP